MKAKNAEDFARENKAEIAELNFLNLLDLWRYVWLVPRDPSAELPGS